MVATMIVLGGVLLAMFGVVVFDGIRETYGYWVKMKLGIKRKR